MCAEPIYGWFEGWAKNLRAKCGKYLPKWPLNCTYKDKSCGSFVRRRHFQLWCFRYRLTGAQCPVTYLEIVGNIRGWIMNVDHIFKLDSRNLCLLEYIRFLGTLSVWLFHQRPSPILLSYCQQIIKWNENPQMFSFLRLPYLKASAQGQIKAHLLSDKHKSKYYNLARNSKVDVLIWINQPQLRYLHSNFQWWSKIISLSSPKIWGWDFWLLSWHQIGME